MSTFFASPTHQQTTSVTNQKFRRSINLSFDNESGVDFKDDDRQTESSSLQEGTSTRDESEIIEVSSSGPIVSVTEPTKLFSMISKRNWASVVKRCKGDGSKEAKTWIVEKNRDGSVRWKSLPIHQACETKAPSEVVKALIAAYPDSLMLKDSAGNLPLHLACRERASKSVIGALLTEEPNAAKVKDGEGRLPIHLASRQGISVQIIDSLIICYYRGSKTTDDYELLPIHWACAQNASPELVQRLLRANPDAIDVKDKWGRTPLSLAQASTNPHKEAVIDALHKDPASWNTNLVDEIETLSQKLEKSTRNEKETEMKLKDVIDESETKIRELEEESNRKLSEMEEENKKLKEEVKILVTTNKYSDEDLEKMNEENFALTKEIKVFQSKLKSFAAVFESMEAQRVALLKITDEMNRNIQMASSIAEEEHELPQEKQRSNSLVSRKKKTGKK